MGSSSLASCFPTFKLKVELLESYYSVKDEWDIEL